MVETAVRREANRLYRTVRSRRKENEVLIITGATRGKVEAGSTSIKNIKRIAREYRYLDNHNAVIFVRSFVRTEP